MNTYEHENNKFITEYEELVDEYNELNCTNLEEDLIDVYNIIKNKKSKTTPSTFFREVKSIIMESQNDLESTDIPAMLLYIFSNERRSKTLLQDYFDDIKLIYDNLPEDELEFTEENRETILNSNLKMVISTAKRYRNRGLSLEDLIGAGNVGLCIAWDRYKPEKNVLRTKILETLEGCPEDLSREFIVSLLEPVVKYGTVKKKFDDYFKEPRIYRRQEVISWMNKNVRKAKFSSVAALWIRAYILQELNTNSRVVKKPKTEIDRDLETYGSYLKENTVSITSTPTDDGCSNLETTVELSSTDNTEDNIDRLENRVEFKKELNTLLNGISGRDRRILFQCFGIGLPRSMDPREIADVEGLTVSRVSQIIQDSVNKMQSNAQGRKIEDFLRLLNE